MKYVPFPWRVKSFFTWLRIKKYTHYRSDVKPEWLDEVIDDDKKG